ncbi:MAG: zinc ribbon domain-containing protein [Proteobacteria bacterium]|nr:zinc ribbon domain-containing protein [Pseudomonadota bacterium]
MGQHQVLFSGELFDGTDPVAARNRMARLLGIDLKKTEQLFSGRTVVLKSQLTFDEAASLKDRLDDLGAISRIKDLAARQGPRGLKSDERVHDKTLHDITAAHHECPRCGYLQLETQFCGRCGVDVATAAKQKRKEDLLIDKKIRELHHKAEAPAPAATPVPVRRIPEKVQEIPPPEKPGMLRRLFGGGN